MSGRQRCPRCAEKALAANRARDRRRIAEGICTRCGKSQARHTRRRCDACLLSDARRKERVKGYGLRAVPVKPPAPVEAEFEQPFDDLLMDEETARLDRLRYLWIRSA